MRSSRPPASATVWAVTVLRLVATDRPVPPGGAVTYLAQHDGPRPDRPALPPTSVDLTDHPLRAPYAQPGGPDASLRWARQELRRLGHDGPVTAVQRKTWNLSAIWRLDRTDPGPDRAVWLKHLPGFLHQETAVLTWLARRAGAAPQLLAADGEGRQLLAHLPGEDRFGAPVKDRYAMVDLLHTIQVRGVDAVDDLVAGGVPDLRAGKLGAASGRSPPPTAPPSPVSARWSTGSTTGSRRSAGAAFRTTWSTRISTRATPRNQPNGS